METELGAAERRALAQEVLYASLGILLLFTVVKHLGRAVPAFGPHAFTVAAAAQLYVPILLIGRRVGISYESLGLQRGDLRRDLLLCLVLCLVTIIPFAVLHHLWQTVVGHRTLWPRWPHGIGVKLLTQVFLVALPEELFFRGYLQRRMELLWPAGRKLFGVPFGKAVIVASAVFALGHFVGEYRPDRLGPFFPALLFGLLRTRTNSLVTPVLYHAFCNVLSDALFVSYKPL